MYNEQLTITFFKRKQMINNAYFQLLLNELPIDERMNVNKHKFKKDQEISLLSNLLIKKSLKDYGKINNCKIKRNILGRPYIEDWSGDFNISHSGDWIVCGITQRGKIGIDIEEIRPIDLDICHEFLSDNELSQFNHIPDKEKLFYQYWTLKESYVKALGIGITFPLKELEFVFSNDKIKLKYKDNLLENWKFYNNITDNNYSLSISSNFEMNYKFVIVENLEELIA